MPNALPAAPPGGALHNLLERLQPSPSGALYLPQVDGLRALATVPVIG